MLNLDDLNIDWSTSYPSKDNVFQAFDRIDLSKCKVVILGQDPYFNGEATGVAFEASEESKMPASLRTIWKEIHRTNPGEKRNSLKLWTDQNVLLLNTALTVEKSKPGSHEKLWKPIMQKMITDLSMEHRLWILFGAKARAFKKFIQQGDIIESVHPAAEGYGGTKFVGNNIFNIANEYLDEPIKWHYGEE